MTTRAIAFVATARPSQALPFFRDLLGLRLVEDTPFAIVFDAHGTLLRVQKAEAVVETPYTVFGLAVDDIEAEVRRLSSRGVQAVRYGHIEQDALGIWTTPGGAKVYWFRDPDGNLLSLSQL